MGKDRYGEKAPQSRSIVAKILFVFTDLLTDVNPHSSAGVVAEEPVPDGDFYRQAVMAGLQVRDWNLGAKSGITVWQFV